MKVEIFIKLKPSILDPQGKAVQNTIHSLGTTNIKNVRISKFIQMDIDAKTIEDAENQVNQICDKILANPNTETYSYQIKEN